MSLCEEKAPAGDRLNLATCGGEQCAPGHQYGPAVRSYYLIHFVVSGRGEYLCGGRRHALSAGQGFLILPGAVTTYRADEEDPWHYLWVGYQGGDSGFLTALSGLSAEQPVFTLPETQAAQTLLSGMQEDMRTLRMGEVSALGRLMELLALIGQTRTPPRPQEGDSVAQEYFRRAAWYIEGNLSQGVQVQDVASFVGLCRSQLFRVFREVARVSPQEWIQRARVRRAEELLASPLTLAEVASSVGFSGESRMSAAFRRYTGLSPGERRRQIRARLGE